MAIKIHPEQGTIVVCDFEGFVSPEMIKRRPAIVISPRFRSRDRLCTVVPLSTTPPNPISPYHFKLHVIPVLPAPYNAGFHWVKADMVYTVSFQRLNLPFSGKDAAGRRQSAPEDDSGRHRAPPGEREAAKLRRRPYTNTCSHTEGVPVKSASVYDRREWRDSEMRLVRGRAGAG